MIRTTFLMEQHIGHYSFYQNLRRFIDQAPEVQATWIPITYYKQRSWLNYLPIPTGLRGTLVGRKQVEEGLSSAPYDIAVFNTQVPASLGLQWLNKMPYVVCTDITPIQFDQMGEHYGHDQDKINFIADAKHRTNMRMFDNAKRILPWSSWTAQSLIDDYDVPAERITILPPGVDMDAWVPDSDQRMSVLPRILFVGGDFKRKGGELLLEAFRRLPKNSAELHIVTQDKLAPEPGVMIYSDMRPNSLELTKLYQSCHIFCLPTRAEAFGIVAVEACAAGLPLITSSVGGLTDIVEQDETGFLIDPDDVDELTHRLTFLVNNKDVCATMGRAARQRAELKFDAHKNGQQLVNILQEIWQEEQ